MRANKGVDICDPKVVTHNYEILRANALGNMNRASEFTIFLRNGMSAWMRAVGGQDSAPRKIRQQTSYAFTESDVDMPATGLASILTDAILNAARPARH
jgi:hypothetical protein